MDYIEQKLELGSKIATGTGSATAIGAGLTLNEVGVIVGIVVGVVGLVVQIYFSVARHMRERDYHKKRMKDGLG